MKLYERTELKSNTLKIQFRTGIDHRMVRARIILELKFERAKITRKPLTSKINTNNLKENKE